MIARHRLHGRGRFTGVRVGGIRSSAGAVRIAIAANGLDDGRVGFALVGLRSAVTRNRLRRRLREAIRPELGRLAGRDAVVTAGHDAAQLGYAELRDALVAALGRALARAEGAGARSTSDNGSMTAPPSSP